MAEWVTLSELNALGRPDVPAPRHVFRRVILSAAALIVAVALVGVIAAQRLAETESLGDAARTADLMATALVQPVLSDALLAGDPDAVALMAAATDNRILGLTVVRVKIWDPTGRVVYSDEPRLVGQTFPLDDEEQDALADSTTIVEVSDLQAPENVFERSSGKLLEAYRPVATPSGSPLLFEAYFRYDEVTRRSGQLWQGFAAVTLGSIVLLVVLLLPVLWRLLANLRREQERRVELLQRAVDASAQERRRIAGTLHDGVVQELAALSFGLSGASRRANTAGDPELAQDIEAAAGAMRSSIGGLRTLLVDIYPQSLSTAGIVAALDDLAESLRVRGGRVEVEVEDDLGLDPAGERLVFRVAQEVLSNAARHAPGAGVVVRLVRTHDSDGTVELEVADDGPGFDVGQQLRHPLDGHFGLRVLRDVAADAGAELAVASAPGEGTRWRMRVKTA